MNKLEEWIHLEDNVVFSETFLLLCPKLTGKFCPFVHCFCFVCWAYFRLASPCLVLPCLVVLVLCCAVCLAFSCLVAVLWFSWSRLVVALSGGYLAACGRVVVCWVVCVCCVVFCCAVRLRCGCCGCVVLSLRCLALVLCYVAVCCVVFSSLLFCSPLFKHRPR